MPDAHRSYDTFALSTSPRPVLPDHIILPCQVAKSPYPVSIFVMSKLGRELPGKNFHHLQIEPFKLHALALQ